MNLAPTWAGDISLKRRHGNNNFVPPEETLQASSGQQIDACHERFKQPIQKQDVHIAHVT